MKTKSTRKNVLISRAYSKNVKALIKTGEENGLNMILINSVEEVNNEQKKIVFKKLEHAFDYNLKGKTIAIWGLSFKPETDDMREAPSITTIKLLLEAGAKIRAFDPKAIDEAIEHYIADTITYCTNIYEASHGADAVALLTEWKQFRLPNWEKIKQNMKGNIVVDGRNIYNKLEMQEMGFKYYSIGK